jgi:phosphoglycerol transferase MdoB-like AlkP superfamily enzyme
MPEMKNRVLLISFAINFLFLVFPGLIIHVGVGFGLYASSAKTAQSNHIQLNIKTIRDRKSLNAAIEKMQKNIARMKNSDPGIYAKYPESEFIKSIVSFFLYSKIIDTSITDLDEKKVEVMKREGMLLYAMDRRHPLMKKSIYIDRSLRNYNRQVIKPGSNIIIVFVESLSMLFFRDDIHGIKGLTPNMDDMRNQSYSFEKMYNTSFTTVRGLIAALGSNIYLLEENIGESGMQIPSRFLFLSNVLKAMNYKTIHIQGGSESFLNMNEFFTKREDYDEFLGSESLTLEKISKLRGGFGVDDATLFKKTVEWMDSNKTDRPFLLMISTINMHQSFKVTHLVKAAGGKKLLNNLYSTDVAFGKFWEYFIKSKYKDITIVIMTTDHAMGNNNDYAEFAKPLGENLSLFLILFHVISIFRGRHGPAKRIIHRAGALI